MDVRQGKDIADARLVPGNGGGAAKTTIEYNPNRPRTRICFSIP